ncbi:MAG: DUF4387 domain-containing protein [Defluviitaleaceae bacterium]|nr:DUF4387 domain-containing protein [Defluviitaleaceae bacterium]
MKLIDITEVIRSKNAGPYELTFDIMFKDYQWFEKVCKANIINEQLICDLYKISPIDIINIVEFYQANAIKITIIRPIASGDLGETDVYGAQQHGPLLDLEFDVL